VIVNKFFWSGAVLICTAPFLIDTDIGKTMICVGLSIVTIQAYRLKAYNMVIMNVVGILGYTFALFT
jgi:hypothetical protein